MENALSNNSGWGSLKIQSNYWYRCRKRPMTQIFLFLFWKGSLPIKTSFQLNSWYRLGIKVLNHFQPMFPFHTPWSYPKTRDIFREYRKVTLTQSGLNLSWRRSLSYKNQSIDLLYKSMDWFLYDRDLCHERVNIAIVALNTCFSLYTVHVQSYWWNHSMNLLDIVFSMFNLNKYVRITSNSGEFLVPSLLTLCTFSTTFIQYINLVYLLITLSMDFCAGFR